MRGKKIPLAWQTVLAAILALITGNLWPAVSSYAGSFAHIFVRILSLLLVPYVFAGICSGITQRSDQQFTGRIILKNLSSFVAMELTAIFVALLVSNIVYSNSAIELPSTDTPSIDNPREFGDFLLNIIPASIYDAVAQCNLPAILLIACTLGYIANRCADRSRIFLTNLFTSTNDVFQRICDIVAALSPLAVFCIFSRLAEDNTISSSFQKVVRPLAIATGASLAIHALITIPITLKVLSKCRPYRFMKLFSNSIYNSMAFSSSTLVMPLAINRMKSEAGISPYIASFSMPLISTICCNGTSIFLACGAMYAAQAYGINLTMTEQLTLVFAVSFITIGTSAGPLKLSLIIFPVMESMGIPLEGMGAIMLCELLFGMLCPAVDLMSNIAITANIAASEGDTIKTETEG